MNSNNTRIAVGAGVVIILLAAFFGIYLLKSNTTKTADTTKTSLSKVSPTPKAAATDQTGSNTNSNTSFTMPATGMGGSCETCDKYLTGDDAAACRQEMGCSY